MSIPLPEPVDDVRVTWRGETEFLRSEADYYTADQMQAYAAAVTAAARDCRTCKRFYDWEEKVCTQSNKNPCVNGDKHDPLPPVRLWRTT